MTDLDVKKNRVSKKYPLRVQLLRVAWALGRIVFKLIPRPLYLPRAYLLRAFGAKVAPNVNIANTAVVYFPWNLEIGAWSSIGEHAYVYNLGKVSIGERSTVSQRAHLCAGTHDFTDPSSPLLTPPIHVGDAVWICADAFLGPGVSIGNGAVVGACAVVVKDVDSWSVVGGNPARFIKKRKIKGASRDGSGGCF